MSGRNNHDNSRSAALRPRTSRRSFLGWTGAGALTAAASTAPALAAAATPAPAAPRAVESATVRRTLAYRSAAGGTIRPGFPVENVIAQWAGEQGGRIRFATQSGGFGRWQPIQAGCPASRGDHSTVGATRAALVPAGRAPAYQVQLPVGAVTVALNCTDGPRIDVASAGRPFVGRLAGLVCLNRAAWGADESLRFDPSGAEQFPQTYWPVQTITVHHTATVNDDPDPVARVRAIYRFQAVDEGFGDIGYHFLIDEAGQVYEGRWSAADGIPGFNPFGRMVNAAHVGGFNAGNVGIALLGTFTNRAPTAAARQTLTTLLALIAGWHQINPLATIAYVNPISGVSRTVAAIPGHRDWAATLCPGDLLAVDLAAIRQDVAALL